MSCRRWGIEREEPMVCPECQSSNRREFLTEMMIHNGSLGATPDLFTFPKTWICFDCGCSTFTLPHNELQKLSEACTVASDSIER